MAQQKQHKQLILNDSKNIFTCRFQQIQRLQPNFITESRRTFIHTKHNRENPKVKIFLLILEKQRIQPNLWLTSARIYSLKVNSETRCKICTKLSNKDTRKHWHRSSVFIVNFEHLSHLVLVFLMLILSRQMPAWIAWEVSYIPNNQTQKHNTKNRNNNINVRFTSNTKFILLQLRQNKLCIIHIQTSQ